MSDSSTNTFSMNGNSTGYGLAQGSEVFNLAGYDNTVLLAGASDTINVANGGYDTIDVNATGFTSGTTDFINLGNSAFNQVISSHAIRFSNISVTAQGGPNTISLDNTAGTTTLNLGNVGDPALQQGTGLGDNVTLNGDASNTVIFSSGGDANVAIGSAGDSQQQGTATVSLYGYGNTLTGGDEAFTVADTAGRLNTVSLGNGANSVSLAGYGETVHLGNGNNALSLIGAQEFATLGGGNNSVITGDGPARVLFAEGHAGSTDKMVMQGGILSVHAGNENVDISSGTQRVGLGAILGNGSNTVDVQAANIVHLTLGTNTANTGENTVTVAHGGGSFVFNGGVDHVAIGTAGSPGSFETITLNGTMLGTNLSAVGVFDNVTVMNDANGSITDSGIGMNITIEADALGGFGTLAINGLSGDDLAKIHLAGASAYTLTADDTPVGGVTLHFTHGSIDLVGLHSVPNNLFH